MHRGHATAVENAAVSQLYRQRPADEAWLNDPDPGPWRSAPWSVALKDDDASAWLTARLPEWVDGQADLDGWPDTLDQPQIHFVDGLMRIGVLLHGEDGDRFLTASVRPELRDDGSLWLHTRWIHIGRLPVPASLLLARAGSHLDAYLPGTLADDPHSARLIDILRGNAPLALKPEMRLEDGRVVRLLGLRVRDGRIELNCQTESTHALAKQ